MLRSGLEDYEYNSYVDLANLVALYTDVLKTTGTMIKQFFKDQEYYVHMILKKLQLLFLDSPEKPTTTVFRE